VAFADDGGYVDCYAERPGASLGPAEVWYGVDVMHRFGGETFVTPYTALRLLLGDGLVLDFEVAAGAEIDDFTPRWRFALTVVYTGGD